MEQKKKSWMKKIIVIVVIIAAVASYYLIPSVKTMMNKVFQMFASGDFTVVKEFVASYGAYAALISFLLMIFQSLSLIHISQHKEGVLEKATELMNTLKAAGYSVNMDDSDKSPGWKFSEQEMLGIPTRIEIGPKDIEKNQVVVVRRDTREKMVVSLDEITTKLGEILETIQKDMFDKAKAFLDSHIDTAVTMDEMIEKFQENRGFIKAMWCGCEECEEEIKACLLYTSLVKTGKQVLLFTCQKREQEILEMLGAPYHKIEWK